MPRPLPAQPEPSPALWTAAPPAWSVRDLAALAVWTAVIVAFFWDVVSLRGALFYFDITEINYPYRHFFAEELRAGRFSRWIPGLYCGHPLYSESQTGYLHPFKYLFYPWLDTWKALNLDCVLSVWLTGAGTYAWLRGHVGTAGALAGAGLLALSGYTWAHFVHTSMLNALASVPFAFWGVELAWKGMWRRGVSLSAFALACQIFAGHLQDAILTGLALALYGVFRAGTERTRKQLVWALGAVVLIGVLGICWSAVQWIPSKELIDRSPRAGGLSWQEITYGSWHFELLPTLLVREAYGTRARDTDWMDGFYPYHEMNIFMGVVGLALAAVGAAAHRDRWVAFWLVLGGIGGLLMLGRFTFLFDLMPHIPIIGTGRVPVRYHLWVAVAAAALAAVGTDRLARADCGVISWRGARRLIAVLALFSVPILVYTYTPAWTERQRWLTRYHADRYLWLSVELAWAGVRLVLVLAALVVLALIARAASHPRRRAWIAVAFPLLLITELLAAHSSDVPSIDPRYWTEPPESARAILGRPDHGRVFGEGTLASGEPGYATRPIDFLAVRELLAWSTPVVWGLRSAVGETPILDRRRPGFTDNAGPVRLEIENITDIVTSAPDAFRRLGPGERVASVTLHRVPAPLPRLRLMGRVVYVDTQQAAIEAVKELKPALREQLVVEDPDRPLSTQADAQGGARLVVDDPEHQIIEIETDAPTYLFLADTFDPGWSARLDNRPVPIRPANVAFRAVLVPPGKHRLEMTYEPAGFRAGLWISGLSLLIWLGTVLLAWKPPTLESASGTLGWPRPWPVAFAAALAVIVLLSFPELNPARFLAAQRRWDQSWHRFTWGAGIEAVKASRSASASKANP